MLRKIISLAMAVIAIAAYAQSGTWSGDLMVQGNRLPLVFHFDDDKPTMDSPAQGAKGIPIKVATTPNGEITVSIPVAGAEYQGFINGKKITGIFKQNGALLPLTLTAGADKPKRPQTPCPPFDYATEEVSFANGDAVLRGTLTLPKGYGKGTPVVLMVTGSGLQNRDEEVMDHKPFAVIADALAREGIATLRYDDRGFGESTGDAVNCTTLDLMNDALAGINLLRERFDHVGVLGHSEGGTIALMLGADNKVDFVISLAGMVVSGKETLLEQNRIALSDAGLPSTTVSEYCRLLAQLFDNDANFEAALQASTMPQPLKQNLEAVAKQMQSPYMQCFVALDPRDRLASIKCPVLALNGTKDVQVLCQPNLQALRDGLPANPRTQIHALEGLNHLLQHCTTGAILEYATIEETISPQALTLITNFLRP